jgi:hypothetical protein
VQPFASGVKKGRTFVRPPAPAAFVKILWRCLTQKTYYVIMFLSKRERKKMFKCEELNKVAAALNAKNIPWKNKSSLGMERIHFNRGAICVSVINGEFSYGGHLGLLETMPPTTEMPKDNNFSLISWANDVEGCLTADEIIAAWIEV